MKLSMQDLAGQMQQLVEQNNGMITGGFISINGSNPTGGNIGTSARATNNGPCQNIHDCRDSLNTGACTNSGSIPNPCSGTENSGSRTTEQVLKCSKIINQGGSTHSQQEASTINHHCIIK